MVLGPVFEARGEWSRQRIAAIEEAQQLSAAPVIFMPTSASTPGATVVPSASFDEVLDATLPPGLSTSVSTAVCFALYVYACPQLYICISISPSAPLSFDVCYFSPERFDLFL